MNHFILIQEFCSRIFLFLSKFIFTILYSGNWIMAERDFAVKNPTGATITRRTSCPDSTSFFLMEQLTITTTLTSKNFKKRKKSYIKKRNKTKKWSINSRQDLNSVAAIYSGPQQHKIILILTTRFGFGSRHLLWWTTSIC